MRAPSRRATSLHRVRPCARRVARRHRLAERRRCGGNQYKPVTGSCRTRNALIAAKPDAQTVHGDSSVLERVGRAGRDERHGRWRACSRTVASVRASPATRKSRQRVARSARNRAGRRGAGARRVSAARGEQAVGVAVSDPSEERDRLGRSARSRDCGSTTRSPRRGISKAPSPGSTARSSRSAGEASGGHSRTVLKQNRGNHRRNADKHRINTWGNYSRFSERSSPQSF